MLISTNNTKDGRLEAICEILIFIIQYFSSYKSTNTIFHRHTSICKITSFGLLRNKDNFQKLVAKCKFYLMRLLSPNGLSEILQGGILEKLFALVVTNMAYSNSFLQEQHLRVLAPSRQNEEV